MNWLTFNIKGKTTRFVTKVRKKYKKVRKFTEFYDKIQINREYGVLYSINLQIQTI